jgi:hypothetical protein
MILFDSGETCDPLPICSRPTDCLRRETAIPKNPKKTGGLDLVFRAHASILPR